MIWLVLDHLNMMVMLRLASKILKISRSGICFLFYNLLVTLQQSIPWHVHNSGHTILRHKQTWQQHVYNNCSQPKWATSMKICKRRSAYPFANGTRHVGYQNHLESKIIQKSLYDAIIPNFWMLLLLSNKFRPAIQGFRSCRPSAATARPGPSAMPRAPHRHQPGLDSGSANRWDRRWLDVCIW